MVGGDRGSSNEPAAATYSRGHADGEARGPRENYLLAIITPLAEFVKYFLDTRYPLRSFKKRVFE